MTAARALLTAELSMVVTDLWSEIDHGDGSQASSFFTPDAELTFSERTFRGTAEIDGVYRSRTARGPRVSRHLASNLRLVSHDGERAQACSVLVLYAQDGEPPVPATAPLLVADVHDHFVRVGDPESDPAGDGGRWLIASRRILNRFLAPGGVLAVPTEKERARP